MKNIEIINHLVKFGPKLAGAFYTAKFDEYYKKLTSEMLGLIIDDKDCGVGMARLFTECPGYLIEPTLAVVQYMVHKRAIDLIQYDIDRYFRDLKNEAEISAEHYELIRETFAEFKDEKYKLVEPIKEIYEDFQEAAKKTEELVG